MTFFDGANKPQITVENDFGDVHEFPLYPNVAEIFGAKQTFSVLLRPDNYIGLITSENAAEEVRNYLR